jgi:hypothetical protein
MQPSLIPAYFTVDLSYCYHLEVIRARQSTACESASGLMHQNAARLAGFQRPRTPNYCFHLDCGVSTHRHTRKESQCKHTLEARAPDLACILFQPYIDR